MGMRGKRGKDRRAIGWYRDTVDEVYTKEKVQADWETLEPYQRLSLRTSWEPKEHKVDTNTHISLIINGLEQRKSIDAQVIDALPAHDDDTHDDDAHIDGKE